MALAGQSRIRSRLAMAGLGADQGHNMIRMGAAQGIDKGVTPSYVSENLSNLGSAPHKLHARSKQDIVAVVPAFGRGWRATI